MNREYMENYIFHKYGSKIHGKLITSMSPEQIQAIYKRMKAKEARDAQIKKDIRKESLDGNVQLSFLNSKGELKDEYRTNGSAG